MASQCGDFSYCGAQALGTWASVAAVHRLWSTGSVVVVPWHVGSSRPGVEPVSSATRGECLCREFCLTPLAACRLSVCPLTLYRSLPTHQAEPHAHPIPSVGDVSWPRGFRHIPGRTSPTAASPGHHAQQHSLSCGSHVVGLSCRFPALADAETPPSWASVSVPYRVVLRPDHLQQGSPNSGI